MSPSLSPLRAGGPRRLRGRAPLFAATALLATLGATTQTQAAWQLERSWEADGLVDLDVAGSGDVLALVAAGGAATGNAVRRYDRSGKLVASWSLPFDHAQAIAANGDGGGALVVDDQSRLTAFDGGGRQTGQGTLQAGGLPLISPQGLDTDGRGDLYVSYLGGANQAGVVRYAGNGQPLGVWGQQGAGPGQFGLPTDVASDGRGSVFVSDAGNDRVQRFGDSGQVVRAWGQSGVGTGQFENPSAVALDRGGDVWVLDGGLVAPAQYPLRVQRFSPDGRYRETVPVPSDRGPRGFGLAFDGQDRLIVGTGRGGVQGGVYVYRWGPDGPVVASTSLRYRRGRVAVQVSCGATSRCRGTVRIAKGSAVIGSRSYSVAASKRATVSVKPTSGGRRALARGRKHRVTVRLKPRSGAAVSKKLTLRR